MKRLSNQELIRSYENAVRLQLDDMFIQLLLDELKRRVPALKVSNH